MAPRSTPRTRTTGRAPRGAQVRPFGGLSPWPASSSNIGSAHGNAELQALRRAAIVVAPPLHWQQPPRRAYYSEEAIRTLRDFAAHEVAGAHRAAPGLPRQRRPARCMTWPRATTGAMSALAAGPGRSTPVTPDKRSRDDDRAHGSEDGELSGT